jgi:hypothetical protein
MKRQPLATTPCVAEATRDDAHSHTFRVTPHLRGSLPQPEPAAAASPSALRPETTAQRRLNRAVRRAEARLLNLYRDWTPDSRPPIRCRGRLKEIADCLHRAFADHALAFAVAEEQPPRPARMRATPPAWEQEPQPLDVVPASKQPTTVVVRFADISAAWQEVACRSFDSADWRWTLADDDMMVFLAARKIKAVVTIQQRGDGGFLLLARRTSPSDAAATDNGALAAAKDRSAPERQDKPAAKKPAAVTAVTEPQPTIALEGILPQWTVVATRPADVGDWDWRLRLRDMASFSGERACGAILVAQRRTDSGFELVAKRAPVVDMPGGPAGAPGAGQEACA